jgi:N utilization substance protein A
VQDQQLSLAIGKEGQNARLAARLTGWRIDIRSDVEESEVAVEAEEALVEEAENGDVAVEASEEISEEVVVETTNEEEVTE